MVVGLNQYVYELHCRTIVYHVYAPAVLQELYGWVQNGGFTLGTVRDQNDFEKIMSMA